MPIFYGQLPFVLAYLCTCLCHRWLLHPVRVSCRWLFQYNYFSGSHCFRFYLLMPNGQSQCLTNCIFDAKLPSHRLAIFRTIVNILRCLRSFEPLFPTETVQLYDEMKRPKVTISSNKVMEVRIDEIDVGMTKSEIFFPITLNHKGDVVWPCRTLHPHKSRHTSLVGTSP